MHIIDRVLKRKLYEDEATVVSEWERELIWMFELHIEMVTGIEMDEFSVIRTILFIVYGIW